MYFYEYSKVLQQSTNDDLWSFNLEWNCDLPQNLAQQSRPEYANGDKDMCKDVNSVSISCDYVLM